MNITATPTSLSSKGKTKSATSIPKKLLEAPKAQPASSEKLTEYTSTTIEKVSLTNSMAEVSDIAKFIAQTTAERNALMGQGYDKYEAGRKVAKKHLGELKEETKRKIVAEAEKTANHTEESKEENSEEPTEEVVIDPSTGKKTTKVKTVQMASEKSIKAAREDTGTKTPKASSPKGTKVDIDV